ncbi:hypothetical protein C8Q76DRAFT_802206 [Earliella scabrosa]|nr:hypothetical protein C8Q76DRAFT_802206 [Earliella scabrosa]
MIRAGDTVSQRGPFSRTVTRQSGTFRTTASISSAGACLRDNLYQVDWDAAHTVLMRSFVATKRATHGLCGPCLRDPESHGIATATSDSAIEAVLAPELRFQVLRLTSSAAALRATAKGKIVTLRAYSVDITCTAVPALFQPIQVSDITLSYRSVLAPLTRFRADTTNVQTDMGLEYYQQRASIAARKITDAVHVKGSYIFLQLWSLGRCERPAALDYVAPSCSPLCSSADYVPRELTKNEIKGACHVVRHGGVEHNGVEVQCANSHLFDQFIQDVSNKRTDARSRACTKIWAWRTPCRPPPSSSNRYKLWAPRTVITTGWYDRESRIKTAEETGQIIGYGCASC